MHCSRFCCLPLLTFIAVFASPIAGLTQESEVKFEPEHGITIELSQAYIYRNLEEESHPAWVTAPAWALNYDFWFHPKWAVGAHQDIILESFEVKKDGEEGALIEREFPFATALMALFKPSDHWILQIGAGGEFSPKESLFFNRAALEYAVDLSEEWEVSGIVSFDHHWDAYDSWAIGIGITKNFVCGK